MVTFENIIADFASFVWGLPLIILLVGGGFYLLLISRFLPFRYLVHAVQVLRGKYDDPNDPGEISHFQALATALAATVGLGNIAGVAVAIAIGGPGAIFWMWISAIIGMATKFFTCTLAVMYRSRDSEGNLQGGPMYFIVEGLGKKWKPLAVFFSIAALVGCLPAFQVNQLIQALNFIVLNPNAIETEQSTNLIIGVFLNILTSSVIFGDLRRISQSVSKFVPAMVTLYLLST